MTARALSVVVVLAAVWGCASARGAYADGMAYETAGDYAAAAAAYATALERDRSLPNVAGRLGVAGREAVRRHLERAAAAAPEGAAQAYLDADALIRRADAVGVTLRRPASFAADRDAALDAAVEALLADAGAALDAGDYAATLHRTARAHAFRPTPGQAAALAGLALDAHLGSAEADFAAGRYRLALSRADDALRLGPDADRADALHALRADVLDAGTVVVAVFPVEGGRDVPARVRYELFDVLAEDLLPGADPFVVLVDPADVRRWDRGRRRAVDLSDSPRRLGEAARDLGADLGAVAVLGPVTEAETAREAGTRTAPLEGSPQRATYAVREVTLTLSATADAVVADAAARGPVCDRPVRQRASATYEVATYDGDWRRLELSRRERAAFDPARADDARAEALDRLRDALAGPLADALARCAAARVG